MITLMQLKQELVIWLRNSDVISVSNRGVTTSQDTGTFSNASSHTLATNPLLLKNVRNIIVGGITLEYGKDYSVNMGTGVIDFTVNQTGVYEINYDQGTQDSVYPDYPQAHLKLNQFPRVGVDIIGSTSNEVGIGANLTQSEFSVSIVCYSIDQTGVENMISIVRDSVISSKKSHYYIPFMTLSTTGPIIVSEFGKNKVMQRNQDLNVRFVFDN